MQDILDMLGDPNARHAMMVHWPIVLGLLGVVPAAVLVVTLGRSTRARVVALVWFALASLGAGLAANSGGPAEHSTKRQTTDLTEAEQAAIHEHEELGEGGWKWPLIPAGLIALSFIPRKRVQLIAACAGLAGALGVAGWISLTADAGGQLVYVHGLGVPERGSADAGPAAPAGPNDED